MMKESVLKKDSRGKGFTEFNYCDGCWLLYAVSPCIFPGIKLVLQVSKVFRKNLSPVFTGISNTPVA